MQVYNIHSIYMIIDDCSSRKRSITERTEYICDIKTGNGNIMRIRRLMKIGVVEFYTNLCGCANVIVYIY